MNEITCIADKAVEGNKLSSCKECIFSPFSMTLWAIINRKIVLSFSWASFQNIAENQDTLLWEEFIWRMITVQLNRSALKKVVWI